MLTKVSLVAGCIGARFTLHSIQRSTAIVLKPFTPDLWPSAHCVPTGSPIISGLCQKPPKQTEIQ
jgi:hypothetical protein